MLISYQQNYLEGSNLHTVNALSKRIDQKPKILGRKFMQLYSRTAYAFLKSQKKIDHSDSLSSVKIRRRFKHLRLLEGPTKTS